MTTVPRWRRYLRLWGPDPGADLDTEHAYHIEALTQHYMAQGLSPADARTRALRRFGNVARVRTECIALDERWERGKRRRDLLDLLWQDVRNAARGLARNPGFTVGAALILALGIGVNTVVYSFNKALLLPNVPIADPQHVVRLWSDNAARSIYFNPLSEAEAADVSSASQTLGGVAAYTVQPVALTGGPEPERVLAMRATTNLFQTLGVLPALGRTFLPAEAMRDGTTVAILSHRTWQNRFAADPAVVGRTVHLDGQTHTIVGVMPDGFWFDSRDIAVWLPLPTPNADGASANAPRTLTVIGRLARGTTARTAQAELQALSQRVARDHPERDAGWQLQVGGLQPLGWGEQLFFALVIGLVSLLLAAACAHIANLLLARGVERQGEMAIRAALGASRGRIVWQLVVESVALSLLGGACSLLVVIPGLAVIRSVFGSRTPFLADLSLDGAALATTAGLAILASLLFGLTPAIKLSACQVSDALKQAPGGPVVPRKRRLAGMLIGFEAAVATLLLIVTVLFIRSAKNAQALPLGFGPNHVVTLRIEVPEYAYPQTDAAARVLTAIRDRFQQLPSVKAAGAGIRPPLQIGPSLPTETITVADRHEGPQQQSPWAVTSRVTLGYFEALEIPIMEGRAFEGRDGQAAAPVAVVSRAMARAYWPDQSAVGRQVKIGGADSTTEWLTVVGVAGDVRTSDPTFPPVRQLYLSFEQHPVRSLTYFVATLDDPTNRIPDIRKAVRDVDSQLVVLNARTMSEVISDEFAGALLGQQMLRVIAALAVLLAVSGVYSVVAYSIVRRRREIAIRRALGASQSALVAMLLRQAVRPALVGVGAGLILSVLVGRAAAGLFYGISPTDPLTYSLVTSFLCAVTIAASCLPTIRAARADTMIALRCE